MPSGAAQCRSCGLPSSIPFIHMYPTYTINLKIITVVVCFGLIRLIHIFCIFACLCIDATTKRPQFGLHPLFLL